MKESSGLVSIITPVYNSQNVLEDTINSVLGQSYNNWELILVDDCSEDESVPIIERYAKRDVRIKPIYLNKNEGAGFARNIGLENATGHYIAFLDADDIWLENKLKDQLTYFENHRGAKFQFSWYDTIDEKNEVINTFKTPDRISFNLLKYNNYILTSTVMCHAEILQNIRFPGIRRRQDWSLFLDILKAEEYAYSLPKVTVQYRKMPNTLSANRWKLIKPNFDFFKNYLYRGNSFKAVFHFILFLPFYFHNKTFNKTNIR